MYHTIKWLRPLVYLYTKYGTGNQSFVQMHGLIESTSYIHIYIYNHNAAHPQKGMRKHQYYLGLPPYTIYDIRIVMSEHLPIYGNLVYRISELLFLRT